MEREREGERQKFNVINVRSLIDIVVSEVIVLSKFGS